MFENVAFGLRLKKMDEETIRRKVRNMLEVVGLKLSLIHIYPKGSPFSIKGFVKQLGTSIWALAAVAVSYTHLDVYKRQLQGEGRGADRRFRRHRRAGFRRSGF